MKSNTLNKLKSIAKKFDLDLFVLFGSRAKGNYTENSDWDFAFYKKIPLTDKKKEELLFELIEILENDNIDLIEIDVIKTPPYLIFNILRTGKVIYEKDKKLYYEMLNNSFIDYIDLEYLLKDIKKKILN